MILKNRHVEKPNEFLLDVLNMTGDYMGTINTLKVKITRDEGNVYEEGTSLDARNLSLFCKGYYLTYDTVELIKNQDISNVLFPIEINQLLSIQNVNNDETPFIFSVHASTENSLILKLELKNNVTFGQISSGTYINYVKLIKNPGEMVVDILKIVVEVTEDSVSMDD